MNSHVTSQFSIKADTLEAMRFIKDALHKCGETTKLDYSCELLTECKQSHSPYIADIKKKKQIEEAEKAKEKTL